MSFPTIEQFREWLQTNPERTFGFIDNCNCPLAQFLRDHGYAEPRVSMMAYRNKTDADSKPLPPWAQNFVMGMPLGEAEPPFTAAQILERLSAIPAS